MNISSFALSGVVGDTISFICQVESFPPPTISWTVNNTIIANANISYLRLNELVTLSTLTLNYLTLDDIGAYRCDAVNDLALRIEVSSDTFNFSIFRKYNTGLCVCVFAFCK